MHVSIISSLVQQCYAPRLVAVTKFKTTKINFEGFFGLSTKISTHENHPPYGSSCPHTLATHKALCEEIVATLEKKPHACMNTIKWVWSWLQATIAHEWLLIWGEIMTEDVLPWICCNHIIISTIRKVVYKLVYMLMTPRGIASKLMNHLRASRHSAKLAFKQWLRN